MSVFLCYVKTVKSERFKTQTKLTGNEQVLLKFDTEMTRL